MPFTSLSQFLNFLESKGDLARIKTPVDPHLEITEIATRVVKHGGPALLFENVKGSRFPLVINLLGAERRVTWALGKTPAEVGQTIHRLADAFMPPTPGKIFGVRSAFKNIASLRTPRAFSSSFKQNVMSPANLDALPIATSWPKDGGPFITFPLILTKSPNDGKRNMGLYRMQKFSSNQTGMHWQIGKGGGYHYLQAEEKGKALPLAVALGVDPVLMLSGVLPLPEGLDEMAFAGFLRGAPTKVGSLPESGLEAPAEAEFVLEGEVPPFERKKEGPYGDHFGHYSHAAPFPVYHIKRIWHRNNPVFPIAVVGKPPQEDQVLGDAVQEMLLPLLKIMHPEVVDLWAYQEAGFHNLLAASVRQRYKKEAVKTALWAFGEGQLSLSKCVILVDPNVNARRFPDLLRAIKKNFNPAEDFLLLPGTSQDTLDFTSFKMNLGSKMILDATSSDHSNNPGSLKIDLAALRGVDERIQDVQVVEDALLAVKVREGGREVLEKLVKFPGVQEASIVAVVSPDIPLNDLELLVWGIFTRFDCQRDAFFPSVSIVSGHPVYRGPLLIDATWKPGYPEPLSMTQSVISKVDESWASYGIPGMEKAPESPNRAIDQFDFIFKDAGKEYSHSH